jgi:regulator of sirC expression with transglutaminase-like and TPR domain
VDALSRFRVLAALPAAELDLAQAALLIGVTGDPALDPDLDVSPWRAELDRWAEGVTDLDGLRRRLFAELGLRGDASNYYDPENSFLHRVMARRRGIPISLSVLTMEVGWRAGIRLEGVGMPGHFLVRVPHTAVYVDAFTGGAVLDEAGCEARFREATGSGAETPFGPHLLPSVSPHAILARMLANLAVIYELRRSGPDLEWVARMQLALPGASAPEALALASALELQGRFLDAARELEGLAGAMPGTEAELLAAAHGLRARFN